MEVEKKARLSAAEMDARAFDAFIDRAQAFLASDPYWMHVLTLPGGRSKRRRVAVEFARLMTTIPKITESD